MQLLTPVARIRTLHAMRNFLATTVLLSCVALCACGPDSGGSTDPEAASAKPESASRIADSPPSKIGVSASNDAAVNAQEAASKKKK